MLPLRNFELFVKQKKVKAEMDRAKQKKTPVIKHSISKKKISSNWLNFLKADGKNFKNSLQLDRKNEIEMEEIKEIKEARKTNFKRMKKTNEPLVTKVLAIDCEMVSDINDRDMLGRVSIVNYKLQCVYDKFVKPTLPIGDYRTRFSGIRESDLENGTDFDIVHKEVRDLIRNKILVGHALGNDFKVLKLKHNRKLTRDSSKYEKFREVSDGKSPSLKKLAKSLLGENIQEGEHSSVEDARTVMKLYIKFRHEWEASFLKTNDKNLILNVKQN